MEKFYQNTTARVFLALVCCALWGSAFPCVKIGYEMFHIEGRAARYCLRATASSCRAY